MAAEARLAILVLVAVGAACKGGGAATGPVPVVSSAPPPRLPASVAAIAVPRDRLEVRPVLDDPRFAAVSERDTAKDPQGAADAIEKIRRAPGVSATEACALAYLEGSRAIQASAPPDRVLAAFTAAARDECPLKPYAKLRMAQTLARSGQADLAITTAEGVVDVAGTEDAKLVVAESLWAKNRKVEAVPLYREWLARNPRGPRWVDTCARIASAILDGVLGEPKARAEEAYTLATRVVVEAPKLADSVGAPALRTRAAKLLGRGEALTLDERARRAQSLLDAQDPARAEHEAAQILGEAKPPNAALCKAALLRASASAKLPKVSSREAWGDAIGACEGQDDLVSALYNGAKASAQAKQKSEALARFGEVERRFPRHRFADDARFRAALVVRDSGDEDRFVAMMTELARDYPDGDMIGEALFRVALTHMQKGKRAEALAVLAKIPEPPVEDQRWAQVGRAAYFRAKLMEEGGDVPGARAQYEEIVRRSPMFFYMALAYGRLAKLGADAAKKTLDAAIARDAEGTFPTKRHDALESAHFSMARELLGVGEIDLARRELVLAKALSDDADPELRAISAQAFDRAGAPEAGHSLLRNKPMAFWSHYPVGTWRAYWEAAYPRAFEPLVVQESGRNGVSAMLTWAIMREESAFVPEARSPSAAFGLMQLIVPTAKWIAQGTAIPFDEASLKRPDVSIALGTKLLARLRATHTEHPALAIAAYNGGSGAVGRWLGQKTTDDFDLFVELIPYEETRNYVKRVLMSQAAYAFLYDRSLFHEALGSPLKVAR